MQKCISLILAVFMVLSLAACSTDTHQATTATTESAPDFQEITLVDNDHLTMKITGVDTDSIWGYTLKIYLENKTDLKLMFSMDDVSVNGFMCDPYWAETVAPGMKSNTTISWFESVFQENGIKTVEEIRFTLRVYDNTDWMADDILNQKFTVNP